jgi:SAM-dependent methyltransferase
MAHTEFDHDQFSEAYPPGIERSWWSLARNHVITRAFRSHIPSDARVLEIGCGTGIVTAHLRRAGWDVSGVDLGLPTQGVHAQEHLLLGTDVFSLSAEQKERFTVLALFDVIEHIQDAPTFLFDLLTAFPKVERVIVTVPARKELWTSFDDHFGHFRRYDRDWVRTQFDASGLRTEHTSYFFHSLYPAITLNNWMRGRKRNVRFTAPAPGLASFANACIAGSFDLEARLLPGSWVGSSIIAIGQRTIQSS